MLIVYASNPLSIRQGELGIGMHDDPRNQDTAVSSHKITSYSEQSEFTRYCGDLEEAI